LHNFSINVVVKTLTLFLQMKCLRQRRCGLRVLYSHQWQRLALWSWSSKWKFKLLVS